MYQLPLSKEGPARGRPQVLGPCKDLSFHGGVKSVARGDRSRYGGGGEAVVEAELHNTDLTVEVKVVNEPASTGRQNVVEMDVSMTEVHEVVFELPAQVIRPSVFHAYADHPAGPRIVMVVEEEIIGVAPGPYTVVPQPHVEASIRKGAAALDIEQPVAGLAKRPAEARGYACDPATAVAAVEQMIVYIAPCEEAASVVVIIAGDA